MSQAILTVLLLVGVAAAGYYFWKMYKKDKKKKENKKDVDALDKELKSNDDTSDAPKAAAVETGEDQSQEVDSEDDEEPEEDSEDDEEPEEDSEDDEEPEEEPEEDEEAEQAEEDEYAAEESFLQYPLSYRVDKVYKDSDGVFKSVPPTYQSLVPSRFGSLNGSIIRNRRGEHFVDYESMAYDPEHPMTEGLENGQGEIFQPVIYNRLVYANQKSRLRGEGDPFRGDLPITPRQTGWFSPSVIPARDLRAGFADADGYETTANTNAVIAMSAGKYDRNFEGQIASPQSNSYGTYVNPHTGDLKVINFA